MNTNTKKPGGSSYGKHLIQFREKGTVSYTPYNKYFFEAAELKGLLYTLPELTKEIPGIFDNPALPLVIDVGCYWGQTVIELAKHNRGINILGLDIKYKRVVKSCRKIIKEKLTNAKIALCDVQEVLPILPKNWLYGMFVFFPDPWIKVRHEKHRYLNERFFSEVSSKLSDQGFIWLKTDHKEYFDETITIAEKYNFSIIDRLPGKIAQREYKTSFEDLFTRQNKPIFQLCLRIPAGGQTFEKV